MKRKTFWRLSTPPYMPILNGLIFEDKRQAVERARQENRCGEFRGRGVKASRCDENGRLIM